jgi:hypothetical protein
MIRELLVPAKYVGCAVLLTACAIPDRPSLDIEGESSTMGSAAKTRFAAAGDDKNGSGPAVHCSEPIDHDSRSLTRTARTLFDNGNYGQAITYAHKALSQDPNDSLAISIAAVSGLRVATKALIDLRRAESVKKTTRPGAEALADLLRKGLGEKVLVPDLTLPKQK